MTQISDLADPPLEPTARGAGAPAWLERLLATASRPIEVFGLFVLAYLTTFAGHYTSGDGGDKRAWAEAMLWRHSADIDPGPGVRYSIYGVGHSLLAAPALVLGWLVTKGTGVHATAFLYTLLFVVNGAALVALVCEYLRHDYPTTTVWKALLLVGLGTMWWPYTKVDFSEAFVATFFFAGFLLAKRGRTALGFAVAGFAITLREDSLVLIACLGLWELVRTRDPKRLVPMALAVAPWMAVNWAANYARYGSIFSQGYAGYGFTNPLLVGLYGTLLSAGKSVFLFSPPLVVGFVAWRRFKARPAFRADALLFIGVFAVETLLFARWWDWSGDDSWGVRYMLTAVVVMTIPAVEFVEERRLFAPVLALGVFVQLLAVLPGPLTYILLVHEKQMQRAPLYVDMKTHQRVDVEDVRYNPRYSQLAGHWMLVERMLGLRGSTSAGRESDTGTPLPAAMPVEPSEIPADLLWVQALRGHLHQSHP